MYLPDKRRTNKRRIDLAYFSTARQIDLTIPNRVLERANKLMK